MHDERYKDIAFEWVDRHRNKLSQWHQIIWNYAEPAWREYKSAAWYVDRLRHEGFEVEEGSGGMPTAFCARWSNGEGPTLGTYAEYDAVPGNAQAAITFPTPKRGSNYLDPGHTDPHSALGISTLGALLATKAVMESHNINGTLKYFGEPAEKVQGSKVVHGLRGYYDDVDAMVSFHPFYMLPLCNTVRWDTHCGAYYSRVYSFVCEEPETWLSGNDEGSPIPASHSVARAPGANVALFSMYSNTKNTQESMLAHSGIWSLNEAILAAGNATADNLPAPFAQIQYSWRTPDVGMAERILEVLDRNAEHAASLAHCQLETRWVSRNRPGVANHALARVAYKNMQLAKAPEYGEQAKSEAREIQSNLGITPMEEPFLPECERLISPWEAEEKLRNHLPSWQENWTSDDYVEMSRYTPTVRLYIGRPALKPSSECPNYPGWVGNALGGISSCIDPTIVSAAKTVAGTLLELFNSPATLEQAQSEFKERTAGAAYIPPLLPADFEAPTDLLWPR